MNIYEIKFTAKEMPMRDTCKGCLFEPERSAICYQAVEAAKLRDLPDCEYPTANGKRIIYVAMPVDERQIDLLESCSTM
jgi:hypothetical protein